MNTSANTSESQSSSQAKTRTETHSKNLTRSLSQKVISNIRYYGLPIVSGILIGTSYIPFPPWALLFCLTPLFVFWQREESLKRVLIGGWLTQFVLNLIGFHWIAYTAVEFGHFPWIFGLLVLLAFAATAHLHYPLAGFLSRWLQNKFRLGRGADLGILVCLFGLCDRFMPMIFPWHLGYPWLWANLPGSQIADLIGFEGLYFITLVINALFAAALLSGLSLRSRKAKPWALAASGFAFFIIVNLLGLGRAEKWSQADHELAVLAVQGNIGNFEKLQSELGGNFGVPVIQKYASLTRDGLSKHTETQLVVWPETAFPGVLDSFNMAGSLYSMLRTLVQSTQTPVLTGAYSRDLQTNGVFNGLFYLDGKGQQPEPPYRKSILLVFGETFPFSEYLPYVEKLFPNQGSFGRGAGPKLFSVEPRDSQTPVRVGPQICYEGLYPWHSSALAQLGAQVFVNVTNDSWFWWPFEPHQHLYMTLARAIEFRRPLVRATNTGITTAMLADGTHLEKSPSGKEWSGLFKIPYRNNPEHTLYEKFGYVWTWFLAGLTFVFIGLGRNRRIENATRY